MPFDRLRFTRFRAGALSAMFLAAFLQSAIIMSLCKAAPEQPDSDVIQRDYLSGNGLLNRGLYELAAAEYRKFLSEHGDHEKSAVARYGLGVSLFRLGQFDEAIAALTPLQEPSDFMYAAETYAIVGQCHLARGRNPEAVTALTTVVERYPTHDLADDSAAGAIEALYAEKRYEEGCKRFHDFRAQWPDSPLKERAEFFGGLSAMGKGAYAEAAELFSHLLQLQPSGPFADQAAFLLAQCYQQGDASDKAIAQYRQVVQRKDAPLVPDALAALAALLYQKGDFAEAGATLDGLMDGFPQSPLLPQARLQRARVWFEQGQYQRALEFLTTINRAEGEMDDQLDYWTAKCQLRLGDAAGAASRLGEAIDKFPTSTLLPEIMYDRGVALVRSGEAEKAIAALESFRARYPNHELAPDALQRLAVTEHNERNYDRSQQRCRNFFTQYPAHALTSTVEFLSCENAFLSEQYDEAAVGFRRFLMSQPNDPQATNAKFRLATALYRLQRFEEAEPQFAELAEAARQNPIYRPALLALGDIHFQRGEWQSAEHWLNDYLSAGTDTPSADDALLKQGIARLRQDRMSEAVQSFDELVARFPESPHHLQALFERGQALVALKRPDDAAKAFENVLADGGESRFAAHALNQLAALAVQRNDLQQAASLYARIAQISTETESEADALLREGQALMAARQFQQAEKSFSRFVERFPSHARASEARGRAAIAIARQDRCAEAIVLMGQLDSDSSLQLDAPLYSSLHYENAWCLRALGKLDEAAKSYRQVIEEAAAGAMDLYALLELAEIEAGEKQFDAAATHLRQLQKALTARPNAAPAEVAEQCLYRLGLCEFEVQHFDESAKLLETFIEQYPRSSLLPSASFYCGEALLKTARFERAILHFARVAGDYPADPAAPSSLLRLGECQAALQRWTLSEDSFQAYLDRFSDGELWYQASFGLGWAKENQRRYDEAMTAYRKVVERHQGPTAARAQFQIGQCLFAQEKHEEAVRELLKVDILYAYPEWSAAALYEAARCFERLGKTAEAKRHFQQVEEKYAKTQWANMAAQRLTELSASATLPGR